MEKINPYDSQEPVNDPNKFWGRSVEVARIFSRIGASRPQSVSLIGEPKIGKTSLIRYLLSEQVRKKYLEDHEKVLLIGAYISITIYSIRLLFPTFLNFILLPLKLINKCDPKEILCKGTMKISVSYIFFSMIAAIIIVIIKVFKN